MALMIDTFILGPIDNNTYLLSDKTSKEAVLIDPAAPSKKIVQHIEKNNLHLKEIWLTHAHFDHIGGVRWFLKQYNRGGIQAVIHKKAVNLWKMGGSARDFGFDFDPGPPPDKLLSNNDILTIGTTKFTVLYTPGHTPGHVTYYDAQDNIAFCGDLIFYHGIGRTDLAISSTPSLMKSISQKILTMPDNTRLYPGHGQFTTVGEEKNNNPFL